MPKICEYCKSEIAPAEEICPFCGATVLKPAPPVYTAPVELSTKGKQTLSLVAFGMAIGGFLLGFLLLPALVIGIIALRQEPEGKTYAKIAIGISAGIMGLWLLIFILAAAVGSASS